MYMCVKSMEEEEWILIESSFSYWENETLPAFVHA
jgi:hypothetical protein